MTNRVAPETSFVLTKADAVARTYGHEFLTLEHMLYGMITLPSEDIVAALENSNVNVDQLKDDLEAHFQTDEIPVVNSHYMDDERWAPRETALLTTVLHHALVRVQAKKRQLLCPGDILWAIIHNTGESWAKYLLAQNNLNLSSLNESLDELSDNNQDGEGDMMEGGASGSTGPKKPKKALEAYCINLNEQVDKGNIDPLIGREEVVEDITKVLARRKKNNAIMVGAAGVGKTAIAEGLAYKIVNQTVSKTLENSVVYMLDVGALLAGARFRGDFEERLKLVIEALEEVDEDPILFIDEIHMIMGAGAAGQQNGVDLANLLKPALAKGTLKVLGSTTADEYRKTFEKDAALVRRFKRIFIEEPTVADTKLILRGISPKYEEFHNVTYSPEALDIAVELTNKYVKGQLPDKAIDIIDSVAAQFRIHAATPEETVRVSEAMIENEVARVAHIPKKNIESTEETKLANLELNLKTKVFGQDNAITELVNAIAISKAGYQAPNKPIGSYLFVGPTGVGKTEVAKQLAGELGVHFERVDMSEYMEKHTVSKFIGSPPGYVGHEDEGRLIQLIDDHPNCVLLLDEIEKAHPDVFAILLQIMDDAKLTSSKGKVVSFRNAVLIMTSNIGAVDAEKNQIGFVENKDYGQEKQYDAVKNAFTPEFRNRLDAVVAFKKLAKEHIFRIVDKFIAELNELGGSRNVIINVTDDVREWLVDKGFDEKMGARPLSRVIRTNIITPVSREILFGALRTGGVVDVSVENNELKFEYTSVSRQDLITETETVTE